MWMAGRWDLVGDPTKMVCAVKRAAQTKNPSTRDGVSDSLVIGAPGEIRTPANVVPSQGLYPAALRAREKIAAEAADVRGYT